MGPRDYYANIRETEIADNKDKARALMECFFPNMADPIPEMSTTQKEIPWESITKLEIERALKAMKGNTAPGEDGLPTLVWKNTWKYISTTVFKIFTASINLGHYPQRWKTAMIVVLRKPGKPDYSALGALPSDLPSQHAKGNCSKP